MTHVAARFLPLVGVVVGVLLVATGCANGPGPATPTPTPAAAMPTLVASPAPSVAHLTGLEISLEFEPAAERSLEDTQTEWRIGVPTLGKPYLPGRTDGRDTVILPISGGDVTLAATPPRGRVVADGSPTLSRSGSSISFHDLVVDLDASRITGTVDGRPLDLFDLDLSRAHVEHLPSSPPTIVDVSARASDDAVREVAEHIGPGLTADDLRVDVEMRLKTS